jgi:predicted DNA binding protein|tara:strand:- start:6057 stop:6353 length:297 start_codon:yes stop_codon:yes gene_type:complete
MAVEEFSNSENVQQISAPSVDPEIFNYDAISKDVRITQKQFEALHTALTHKYYSWPRKVTLEQLAQKASTTRRAFQENLRKAEAKIFPHIVKKFMRGE